MVVAYNRYRLSKPMTFCWCCCSKKRQTPYPFRRGGPVDTSPREVEARDVSISVNPPDDLISSCPINEKEIKLCDVDNIV